MLGKDAMLKASELIKNYKWEPQDKEALVFAIQQYRGNPTSLLISLLAIKNTSNAPHGINKLFDVLMTSLRSEFPHFSHLPDTEFAITIPTLQARIVVERVLLLIKMAINAE